MLAKMDYEAALMKDLYATARENLFLNSTLVQDRLTFRETLAQVEQHEALFVPREVLASYSSTLARLETLHEETEKIQSELENPLLNFLQNAGKTLPQLPLHLAEDMERLRGMIDFCARDFGEVGKWTEFSAGKLRKSKKWREFLYRLCFILYRFVFRNMKSSA